MVNVISNMVKFDESFFEEYEDLLDIASEKAAQRTVDRYFIGRNKYRKDGRLSKYYITKVQQKYDSYRNDLRCQGIVFLRYIQLVLPFLTVNQVTVPLLTKLIYEYFEMNALAIFSEKSIDMSVDEMKIMKSVLPNDVVGCYLIYNVTKQKCYVGQSNSIYNRLFQHFSCKGCEAVYADYLQGDVFRLTAFPLCSSQYNSLDEMEREYILRYDAFTKGYNKTIGNRFMDL